MAFGSDVVQTPSRTPAACASSMMRVMPGRSGSSPLAMSPVKMAVLRLWSSGISVARE
jgi:hypothetical protein